MATKSRHLFVIDPLEKLSLLKDTTIKLAFVLHKHGAEVYLTTLEGLIYQSHPQKVSARASAMQFGSTHWELSLETPKCISFDSFQTVQMRKEPPYDLPYVEALWILAAGRSQTRVVNDPLALQQLNEKLLIAEFSEFSKPLLVSSDPQELLNFSLDTCHGDVVCKPLNLYGGHGVVHLKNPKTLKEDFLRETAGGTAMRLVQKFQPEVSQGEVRAFAVAGKPIAWCLKTPAQGEFLANTRAGSTLAHHVPSPREVEVVTAVSKALLKKGVYVTGFDLIDGWLSEVNITCPALLGPERESLAGFEEFAKEVSTIHS